MQQSIKQMYNIATFDQLQLNYWGIPKCGNTTIKYILMRADSPDKLSANPKAVHQQCTYLTPTQAIHNGYQNFTVLRNPIDRLYSMHKSLSRLGPDMHGSDNFRRDVLQLFRDPTVEALLRLIQKYRDEDRNIHFRSQASYCLTNNITKLKLENIKHTVTSLHPNLVVDVELNKIEQEYESDPIIDQMIHATFAEDFKLWEQAL